MNFNPKMYRSVTHGVIKPRCSLTASDLLRHVSAVVLLVTDPGLRNTTSVLAGKLVGLTGLSWTGQDRTGQDRTGKDSYSMQSVHNSCNERCDGRLLVSAKCKLFITKLCYRALRGPKATEHVLPFDRSSVSYGLARGGAGVISHSCGICMSM